MDLPTRKASPRLERRRGTGASRSAGFTILEIMIATAILTLGLVGILSLFPVAVHTGGQVVANTTAAVIAQSVAESIREGLRNRVRHVRRGNAVHSYFVFAHDGVKDPLPARRELERPEHDYYILLPRHRPDARFASRQRALEAAPTFVYPETDSNRNGGGDAFAADNDGDDRVVSASGGRVYKDVLVEDTYKLGRFLPSEESSSLGKRTLPDQTVDVWKQYSFAFTIQPSMNDVNLNPDERVFVPGNRLYRVKVMVFRGFVPNAGVEPVLELHFEVSL